MKIGRVIAGLLILLVAVLIAAGDPACPVDPSAYPGIGKEEMGQLRWTLKLADQPPDDFSNLEGENQLGMHSYRYQIAFLSYALALEQYHKLPAYRELIQPALGRLIEKMIRKPVWEYWARVSQGVPNLEPRMNRPYPEAHDPVGDINIMYSGHLGHMIGLYEMLYRDLSWDRPESIVFAWSEKEKFLYDHTRLEQVMWKQMNDNPWHSIACEPNAVFPECNQHPALSFMLYDWVHGTHLAEVNSKFFDFFLARKLIDPKTHETAGFYLIKQDQVFSIQRPLFGNAYDLLVAPAAVLGAAGKGSPSANGWTGAFMHAWQPEYIERHYPTQRDNHLREVSEEMARLNRDVPSRPLKYGFFAAYAAELGDTKTVSQLLAFADRKHKPQWRDGMLYYPWDKSTTSIHLTGDLIFLARANLKDGLKSLHQNPWPKEHFQRPYLEGVDYPKLLIRRAIYDPEKKALIVSSMPGPGASGSSKFQVRNLTAGKPYALWLDGKLLEEFQGQDPFSVVLSLDGPHDLVVIAQ